MATADSKDYLLVIYYDDDKRKNLPSTHTGYKIREDDDEKSRIRRFVFIFWHDEFVFSFDSFSSSLEGGG